MEKVLLVMIAAIPLVSGCASSLGTVMNRPVVENSVGGVVSTVSLSAERRNVVVVTAPGKNQGKYCAEPPPDTAKEIATQLKAAVEAQARAGGEPLIARGSLDDLYREQMHVLATRTPALDAFRIGLYALCQMYVIEALTEAEVNALFGKLIDKYPWDASSPQVTRAQAASNTQSAGPGAPSNPSSPSAPAKPQSPAQPVEVAPIPQSGTPGT